MANPPNGQGAMNEGNQGDDVITQVEFRAFQRETQQALQAIQATLARLTTGNNQQREEERIHEDYRERFHPAREHNPIPRRQLAYEEELSDDEEFAERILRPNRQGYHNMGGREPQAFRMKMDLPSFNGQLQIEDCKQGNRTVQAYVEEFHRLSSRNNLAETDAQQVARFVGGLRLNVQDRVSMHTIYSLTEAINLATKAETQLERTRSTGVIRPPFEPRQNFPITAAQRGKLPMNPPPSTSNFTKGPSSSRTQVTTAGPVPPEAPRNPYSRPSMDKCYRCGQPGHRSNQCPKRGVVNLIEQGEDPDVEAEGTDYEAEDLYEEDEITGEGSARPLKGGFL
uniref:CCHC-type domain-containing protein n=1 Tax=Salix viminalis TaxID=40686 RepID=A0A6N2LY08_SALVM